LDDKVDGKEADMAVLGLVGCRLGVPAGGRVAEKEKLKEKAGV